MKTTRKAEGTRGFVGHKRSYWGRLPLRDDGVIFVQDIAGHRSVRTTEIYTHVSKKEIKKIRSPIESILQPKRSNTK